METPFKNDPFALVWQAFKNLYPDKDCSCFFSPEEIDTGMGFTDFNDDGTVFVLVDGTIPVMRAAEILAHELAHVAVGVGCGHGDAWEYAFDKIHKEYNRLNEALYEED